MPVKIATGYERTTQEPLDALYLNSGSVYSSTASANSAININVRYTGSFVNVGSSLYWYKNGVQDSDLVAFTPNIDSSSLATTGSNTFRGNQVVSGSVTVSGSLTATNATSSFSIVSASFLDITGKQTVRGYMQFYPTNDVVPVNPTASYIFCSGSTSDLYFSQNDGAHTNVTRLRWLEGNMYTGLLNGGVITTQSLYTYQVSSGSGIVVNLNASLSDNPYPTVSHITWPNLSASIAPLSGSYDQQFVGINSTGSIFAQGVPFSDGQFDTLIPIGVVLHQNHATINGVKTNPSVAYGLSQRHSIFTRAFGPLKLSGFTLAPSGSSTGSLVVGSGTAYADGANYITDPNNSSYVTDSGTNTSRILRYYNTSSYTSWVYDTNNGAGYGAIDPTRYSNNGVLTAVPGTGTNREWTIQRVFWFPNSPAKSIIVYYGNTVYTTKVDAIANVFVESFVEAPNTAANAIYIGALVVRNNANFTDSTSYAVVPGGLFRNVGGSGGGGSVISTLLSGLADVTISGPASGEVLTYDATSARWVNSTYNSSSISGNAATATKLQTARTLSITGDLTYTSPSFDGSANVTATGSLASIITAAGPIGSATVVPIITYDAKGRLTVVTSATIAPAASSITGGAALTKTDDTNVTLTLGGAHATSLLAAASLTLGWTGTLSVARGGTGAGTATTINGASITYGATNTITAAAGTLTGTILNSSVITSSLTSVGTIATGVWQGTAIADSYIASSGNWNTAYSTRVQSGLLASRPAAGTTGANYYATDNGIEYYDNGTSWVIKSGALTGDITTTANSLATTLATVNSNVGSFGSTSIVPIITVNGKGLITAVSTGTITPTTIGAQPLAANLTSFAALSYVSTSFVKMTASGTFTLDTNTYLTGNQTITLSGDVSGSGTTAITTTIGAGKVTNAMLVNNSVTINGSLFTLGASGSLLSGTGFVKVTGTTISYDNSTYLTTSSISGTTNYIPVFTSSTTLGNSYLLQQGSNKVTLDGSSNLSEYSFQVGDGRTTNGFAYLDLVGDATYTDYGLRLGRSNTGANAASFLTHRGTGTFTLETLEAAAINFNTSGVNRVTIASAGDITINGYAKIYNTGDAVSSAGIPMLQLGNLADTDFSNLHKYGVAHAQVVTTIPNGRGYYGGFFNSVVSESSTGTPLFVSGLHASSNTRYNLTILEGGALGTTVSNTTGTVAVTHSWNYIGNVTINAGTKTLTNVYGVLVSKQFTGGTATITNNYGINLDNSTAAGHGIGVGTYAAASITNQYGIYYSVPNNAISITNQYAFYSEDVGSGYSFYSVGGNNYLGGSLTVVGVLSGTSASFSGNVAPLRVSLQTNGSYSSSGTIGYTSGDGTYIWAKGGTSSNFLILNDAGSSIFTMTSTGATTFASTVTATGFITGNWSTTLTSNHLLWNYSSVEKYRFRNDGIFQSQYGYEAYKNGSNTFGAGAYIGLINSSTSNGWFQQLNVSNNIDFWYYNGTSGVIKQTFGNDGSITLNTAASNGGAIMKFLGASSYKNWLVGNQFNVSDAFEITPSTATGGSTFTTPVFTLTPSGNLTLTGTVTSTGFYESSDLRYKNIISRIGDMVQYTWKAELNRDSKIHYGYIAQEVEKIYPSLVNTDEKGFKSVNYTELLVKKISDLEREIEELKKRV